MTDSSARRACTPPPPEQTPTRASDSPDDGDQEELVVLGLAPAAVRRTGEGGRTPLTSQALLAHQAHTSSSSVGGGADGAAEETQQQQQQQWQRRERLSAIESWRSGVVEQEGRESVPQEVGRDTVQVPEPQRAATPPPPQLQWRSPASGDTAAAHQPLPPRVVLDSPPPQPRDALAPHPATSTPPRVATRLFHEIAPTGGASPLREILTRYTASPHKSASPHRLAPPPEGRLAAPPPLLHSHREDDAPATPPPAAPPPGGRVLRVTTLSGRVLRLQVPLRLTLGACLAQLAARLELPLAQVELRHAAGQWTLRGAEAAACRAGGGPAWPQLTFAECTSREGGRCIQDNDLFLLVLSLPEGAVSPHRHGRASAGVSPSPRSGGGSRRHAQSGTRPAPLPTPMTPEKQHPRASQEHTPLGSSNTAAAAAVTEGTAKKMRKELGK